MADTSLLGVGSVESRGWLCGAKQPVTQVSMGAPARELPVGKPKSDLSSRRLRHMLVLTENCARVTPEPTFTG